MKTKLFTASAIGLSLIAGSVSAETSAEKLDRLEKEVQLLKRQLEVNDEKAAAVAEKAANVEFGSKGLVISSPDKSSQISLRGTLQLDNRAFLDDEDKTGKNEFIARRLRPVIEGKSGNASFRLMPDFAGSSPSLFDAHVDYKLYDELQFRMGKFKTPVSLERLQSPADTFFAERGHASNLAPNRDLGLQVYGELIPGQLEYQLAIMNGNPDLANSNSDDDDKKDYIARVFAHPFANSDIVDLQGLGVGIAGSIGERNGDATTTILTGGYRTPGQQTFFKHNAGSYADGTHWRLYPQAYWYSGNLGLLGEYAISNQEVTNGANHEELQHKAWQVAGSYVLTGEDVNFKGGIKPAENFSLEDGGIGAFELVSRFGATDIDDDTFPLFANANSAATEAQSFGVGLNWYLNQNAKLVFDYDRTTFEGGSTTGDRDDEDVLISRIQYRF